MYSFVFVQAPTGPQEPVILLITERILPRLDIGKIICLADQTFTMKSSFVHAMI